MAVPFCSPLLVASIPITGAGNKLSGSGSTTGVVLSSSSPRSSRSSGQILPVTTASSTVVGSISSLVPMCQYSGTGTSIGTTKVTVVPASPGTPFLIRPDDGTTVVAASPSCSSPVPPLFASISDSVSFVTLRRSCPVPLLLAITLIAGELSSSRLIALIIPARSNASASATFLPLITMFCTPVIVGLISVPTAAALATAVYSTPPSSVKQRRSSKSSPVRLLLPMSNV